MRVIKPMLVIETPIDTELWGKKLEYFTRKCYKSEGKTTESSWDTFIRKIFQTIKHEGIIEHFSVSVTAITDRGVSHEWVRHRMATYLQESTRYCDYSGKGNTYILPPWVKPAKHSPGTSVFTPENASWFKFMDNCLTLENMYNKARSDGWKPQEARYWLPNGIKTEFVATMNLGSMFNFFRKRSAVQAHPQIRQLAVPYLRYMQEKLPMIFDGMELPVLDYEEAVLIEHFGTECIDDKFVEVVSV